MRSYEELEANAYKKAEQIINESKRKKKIMLRRSFGLTLGAAAIIGLGICANALKPPKKPTVENSGIITETTTATSVETTVKMSAQTGNATADSADTSKTTATPVTEQNSAPVSATVTAPSTRSENAPDTTITHSRQTSVQSNTAATERTTQAAEAITSSASTSKETGTKETGTTAVQTTAVTTNMATESITTTQSFSEWLAVYYLDTKTTYRAAWNGNEKITASEDELGDYLGEQTLHLTYTMSNEYVDEVCKVYAIKRFSPDYVLAIQSPADDSPKLCYTGAKFQTLGDLLTGTDLKNTLVLKEAYRGFIEPNSESLGVPELSELMNLLSNESLKSLDSSVYGNTRSYTIKAEIPYLGKEGRIVIIKDILDSESGYISFEILGNKCTYNVGADKINSFILSFTS